jgi:hypothetical protein
MSSNMQIAVPKFAPASGARDQVEALANRLPAAGMFVLYCEQEEGRTEQIRFGGEPACDSPRVQPAPPWDWQDLA